MRRKLYIVVISVLTLITISTAFIPLQKNKVTKDSRNNEKNKIVYNHPEAGYIEDIGR